MLVRTSVMRTLTSASFIVVPNVKGDMIVVRHPVKPVCTKNTANGYCGNQKTRKPENQTRVRGLQPVNSNNKVKVGYFKLSETLRVAEAERKKKVT